MAQITTKSRSSKHGPLLLGALLLACIVVLVLELTNTTHFFHSRPAKSGPIPTISKARPAKPVPGDKSSGSNSGNTGNVSGKTGDNTGTTGSTQPPITPFGTFVSNHRPGQNGTDAKEQSTCNSTPGATCAITFTNQDGIIKTLAAQTLDSSGAAYWTWDAGQAGLTTGSWKAKATVTLNGQTAEATDPIALEVQ